MIVLGLSGVFGHDAAACLVAEGRVVAAAEEERFTRSKHALGQLPVQSTLFCLGRGSVRLDDVDCIAASWDPISAQDSVGLRDYLTWLFQRHDVFRGQRLPPVHYVDHHTSHAAAACFASGFAKAAVLVIDGNAETSATSIGVWQDGHLRFDQSFGVAHSLGRFYGYATEHVGMVNHSEGKLMGLAAYGDARDVPSPISLTDDGYAVSFGEIESLPIDELNKRLFESWQRWLVSHFGPVNLPRYSWCPESGAMRRLLHLPPWAADLAATVQSELERIVLHLAKVATKRYGTRNLVLSGGVALNCSANGALHRSGLVDDLYVFPASHDGGGAIGAAIWVASRDGPISPCFRADLGPSFSTASVARILRRLGISYEEPPIIAERVAGLLLQGKTVGWFQGCMEIGPRALGHRSILAWPESTKVRDRVNQIKGREMWRPLAPSMLYDEATRLLRSHGPFPYMLVASHASDEGRAVMPAVIHVDGTVRAQTVPRGSGPYADLLLAVQRQSGTGVILNTSFNLDSEPIVCTPSDAIRTFYTSELDALAIEGILIERR